MNGHRGPAWLPDLLALLVITLAFSNVGFRNLDLPGIYEDEAWSATAAVKFLAGNPFVGAIDHGQFRLFGRAWPFMSAAYVGPVKSYLLIAAFSVFGISVPVLRATTASLGLLTAFAVYGLMRWRFGRFAAFAAAMLLATDLTFVLGVRCDWGPVAFSLLMSVAFAWALLAWTETPDSLWIPSLAGLFLGLGVLQKLDFLAPAAALFLAFCCVWPRLPLRKPKSVVLLATVALLAASPILAYNVLTRGETVRVGRELADARHVSFPPTRADFANLKRNYVIVEENVRAHLKGVYLPDWMLGYGVGPDARFGPSLMPRAVLVAPFVLLFLAFPAFTTWRRPSLFFLAALLFTLLFLALVPMASGPHHYLLCYPFPHVLLAIALALPWALPGNRSRFLRFGLRSISVVLFLALLVPNLCLETAFRDRLLRSGGRGYWSAEAISSIATTIQQTYPTRTITLMDWGFERSLVLLGRDRYSLDPAFWRVLAAPDKTASLADLLSQSNRVFIVHTRNDAAFKPVLEGLEELSKVRGLTPVETKIFERDGRHFASVLAFASSGDS